MTPIKLLNRSMAHCTNDAIKLVCILKPIDPEQHTIHLTAGLNIVGRSKETRIRDMRCSKQQLELDVDFETCMIRLKVLGVNPSGVNGFMVMQNTECDLLHGDILEIVYGRNTFEIVFERPVDEKSKGVDSLNKSTQIESKILDACWDMIEDGKMLVFNSKGLKPSAKIAGYDIDGTIIRTKSGNVFPKNCDDWQLNYPEVRSKLRGLYEEDYKICFFTNQGGIAKGKVKLDEFKQKVINIQKQLGVPVQVFIAISNGFYRKPAPGMWQHLEEHKNNSVPIKLDRSFYVGDAAGRPECGTGSKKRKKDHSLADRLFAENIGVNFYTPEEHFIGAPTEYFHKPEFEPRSFIDDIKKPIFEPATTKVPRDGCELVLLVGLPGSGKSHFAKYHLQPLGYRLFNADTLGSIQACIAGCQKSLCAGHSCVVDNTNVDVQTRKKFIDLAKTQKVPCRCLIMNVGLPQIKHNIAYRHLVDTNHAKINDMVMNIMKKKYIEPTIIEGFEEIIRVNPKLHFDDDKFEKLYRLHLVEK